MKRGFLKRRKSRKAKCWSSGNSLTRHFWRFIGLFLDNERAILWEHSDMEEYNRKEQRMLDAMIRLRDRYSDSAQILRIDTVMQLLADKKRHIKSLMDAPTTASRIDSLLSRELPELERRTSSHTTIITNRGSEPSAGIEKKKNLFSWLKRRSKKDREENVGNGGTEVRTRTDVQQLHAVRQFGEDIRTASSSREDCSRFCPIRLKPVTGFLTGTYSG